MVTLKTRSFPSPSKVTSSSTGSFPGKYHQVHIHYPFYNFEKIGLFRKYNMGHLREKNCNLPIGSGSRTNKLVLPSKTGFWVPNMRLYACTMVYTYTGVFICFIFFFKFDYSIIDVITFLTYNIHKLFSRILVAN